jgi:hypothetical protein
MGSSSSASGCKLTATSDPAVFNASPGAVTLLLTSTKGNVTFMVKDTDVLDGSGQSVNPTKTATTLKFTVKQGQTYLVETEYFIFPTDSTGTLQESCTGGVVLSQVDSLRNPQQFTVKG